MAGSPSFRRRRGAVGVALLSVARSRHALGTTRTRTPGPTPASATPSINAPHDFPTRLLSATMLVTSALALVLWGIISLVERLTTWEPDD